MIESGDLRKMSRARLRDAEVLLKAKRFDCAYYICGYAVELALKARICRTLKWVGFPETGQEFKGLLSVKTHDLETLLKFSGIRLRVTGSYAVEWWTAARWNPEKRYRAMATAEQAAEMVDSARRLLGGL